VSNMMGVTIPSIGLNKDFLITRMEAGILRELFNAYFNGAIDKDTLVYNLKRSEYLDPTIEDENQLPGILTPEQIAALKKPATPQPR